MTLNTVPRTLTLAFNPMRRIFTLKAFYDFMRYLLEEKGIELIEVSKVEGDEKILRPCSPIFGCGGCMRMENLGMLRYTVPDLGPSHPESEQSVLDFLATLRILYEHAESYILSRSAISERSPTMILRGGKWTMLYHFPETYFLDRCSFSVQAGEDLPTMVAAFGDEECRRVEDSMNGMYENVFGLESGRHCQFTVSGSEGRRIISLTVPGLQPGSLILNETIMKRCFLPHNLNGWQQMIVLLAGLATIGELAFMKDLAKT